MDSNNNNNNNDNNQNIHNVIFPVSPLPMLKQYAEPKPFHKNAPGYDMKTLRKQIDTIQLELNNRLELYNEIYNENNMLWNYTQELVQLNNNYGKYTINETNKMKLRFDDIFSEKENLANKLIEYQNLYTVSSKFISLWSFTTSLFHFYSRTKNRN